MSHWSLLAVTCTSLASLLVAFFGAAPLRLLPFVLSFIPSFYWWQGKFGLTLEVSSFVLLLWALYGSVFTTIVLQQTVDILEKQLAEVNNTHHKPTRETAEWERLAALQAIIYQQIQEDARLRTFG